MQEQLSVSVDCDRVLLTAGRMVAPLPYAAANKIAAYLSLASNHSANLIHADIPGRLDVSIDLPEDAPQISDQRRGTMPARFDWKLDVDSERVTLTLGNCEVRMHYSVAAALATQIKAQARLAKAWAGDTSKQWVCVGNLTNAEQNYKRARRHL